jgi:hypothetical protein
MAMATCYKLHVHSVRQPSKPPPHSFPHRRPLVVPYPKHVPGSRLPASRSMTLTFDFAVPVPVPVIIASLDGISYPIRAPPARRHGGRRGERRNGRGGLGLVCGMLRDHGWEFDASGK